MADLSKTMVAAALALTPLAGFAAGNHSMLHGTGSKWAGPYVGGQVGINDSSAAGATSNEIAFSGGASLGYNKALQPAGGGTPAIVGADFFTEFNSQATHSSGADYGSNALGIDFLAGYPLGNTQQLMPYVKVGFGDINATGDLAGAGDVGARIGVGAELWLAPAMGLVAQWMHQDSGGIANDNFTVGMNFHFGH